MFGQVSDRQNRTKIYGFDDLTGDGKQVVSCVSRICPGTDTSVTIYRDRDNDTTVTGIGYKQPSVFFICIVLIDLSFSILVGAMAQGISKKRIYLIEREASKLLDSELPSNQHVWSVFFTNTAHETSLSTEVQSKR